MKHLVYENKKVNASENTCFVLGGVQAEDTITDDELHSHLGKEPGRELKAKKDLKGTFEEILRDKEVNFPVLILLTSLSFTDDISSKPGRKSFLK